MMGGQLTGVSIKTAVGNLDDGNRNLCGNQPGGDFQLLPELMRGEVDG